MKTLITNILLTAIAAMLVMVFHPMSTPAQSAQDGFDPQLAGFTANSGIRATLVQPDGKMIIGGDFTSVLGTARNHIARVNPDGTLDTAFDPNSDNAIYTIALQADGKIVVGGAFSNMGGLTRKFISRLDPTTGAPDTFNPVANNSVDSIAIQTDGKIVVGGGFTTIGSQTRNRIARLDATTGVPDSFNPNANNTVLTVVIPPDGRIVAGGMFTTIGGQTRNHVARLDSSAGLADGFNPNADNFVFAIAVQTDGKFVLGGWFTNVGGTTRNHVARVSSGTGALDTTFNPNAADNVYTIAIQTDGKILVGGAFFNIGGQARGEVARLNRITGAPDSFNPNANDQVLALTLLPAGKVLIGGLFQSLGTVSRNRLARLESDGTVEQTLSAVVAGIDASVTVAQPDGKIIVAGDFTTILGTPRNHIARINLNGTLDMTFDPHPDGPVKTVAIQKTGKILIGGGFGSVGVTPRRGFARVDPTTGAPDSLDLGLDDDVNAIAVDPVNNQFMAAGKFKNAGGAPHKAIVRADATTGAVDPFDPGIDSSGVAEVNAIAIDGDGVLIGGSFDSAGGKVRKNIARVKRDTGQADNYAPIITGRVKTIAPQSDRIFIGGDHSEVNGDPTAGYIAATDKTLGTLKTNFHAQANGPTNSIAVQSNGSLVVCGEYTSIGGQVRHNIARIDRDTGAADSFDPDADGPVNSCTLQPDGKILAGGNFNNIGGKARSLFARLSNDTASQKLLNISQNTITLTRGGSAPSFDSVVFERSLDNGVTWTTLGNATTSAPSLGNSVRRNAPLTAQAIATYTLSGQNNPTGQDVLIRATGSYHGGFQSGSETTEENLQAAFIGSPTAASVTISGRVFTPEGGHLLNAVVSLTDSNGQTRQVRTNSSGYYSFDEVTSGKAVILSVVSKRFRFASQVVSVTDQLTDVNFSPL